MSDDDDDEAADPFERLRSDDEREGDPFENLQPSGDDIPSPDETPARPTGRDDERDDEGMSGAGQFPDDPFADAFAEGEADAGSDRFADAFAEGEADADDVVDDGDDRPMGSRQRARDAFPERDADADERDFFEDIEGTDRDPFDADESVFERVDVGDVDPDEVWERIHEAREKGVIDESAEGTEKVVSKHTYCEHCEYFSEPPSVECGHERTEILRFPDMEHVIVVDCPVVAEREELEELSE